MLSALKGHRRTLHSAVPRRIVTEAIRKCLPSVQQRAPDRVPLGANPQHDFILIQAASEAAARPIPDCDLALFKTTGDVIRYLCTPVKAPEIKGIPKFELFHGDCLPPNVLLINYRKRRWTAAMHHNFLRRSLGRAGLRPDTLTQNAD